MDLDNNECRKANRISLVILRLRNIILNKWSLIIVTPLTICSLYFYALYALFLLVTGIIVTCVSIVAFGIRHQINKNQVRLFNLSVGKLKHEYITMKSDYANDFPQVFYTKNNVY